MLTAGSRLGPYEIGAPLGAGGMGEVYRATDIHLGRDVAIKVLPEAFAHDSERLARFEREARTLATLNHPHIAAVYGLEKSAGVHALVMELVDGPTLADRIALGAIPLDEALPIAAQIAEALQAAHEQGIVHRDLKPANVKVRHDGTVKVLDFGLAKLVDGPATAGHHGDLSLSPTITTPAMTQLGVILGTAAYMSPEQAKGRPADKRTDIWAFGCVLFEMLSGKRAFEGDGVSDTLAIVLRGDPDWKALPSSLPLAITRVLRRCLERDPKQRLHDIGDAQILNEEISSLHGHPLTQPSAPWKRRAWSLAAAVALVLAGGALASLVLGWRMRPAAARVERFELVTPSAARFTINPTGPNVALSADGSQMVYTAQTPTRVQLALKRFAQLEPVLLPGTDSGLFPAFSPDGTQVVFGQRRKLLKVNLPGGPVIPVCDLTGELAGASWGNDNVIVFAERTNGLFRVSAAGGAPEKIAAPDTAKGELDYTSPEWLPGGKTVLFTIVPIEGTVNQARIVVRELATGTTRVLVESATPGKYVPTGHLVYTQAGALLAAPFDIRTLSIIGTAVVVQQEVASKLGVLDAGSANFSIASDGSLITAPAAIADRQRVVWRDRTGTRLRSLTEQPLQYPRYPRISPDGRRLALTVGPGNEGQIWIYDLTGASQPRRLTVKGHNTQPTWSPDGKFIAFSSTLRGPRNLMQLPSDTSSLEPVQLTKGKIVPAPMSWSESGLLFREVDARTREDLWLLPMTGDRSPRPWLAPTDFVEDEARFSTDGQWVAYVTDQTGQSEVWIRPFAAPGEPTRVSSSGGHDPVWSRDGEELFYQDGVKLMSVAVTVKGSALQVSAPRQLFEGGFVPYFANTPRTYDVAADGRFLMIEPDESAAGPPLVLVKNWFDELKRLVPPK